MVAISFEASIDDRSSSSSSGVHKKLRGTVISPSSRSTSRRMAAGSDIFTLSDRAGLLRSLALARTAALSWLWCP